MLEKKLNRLINEIEARHDKGVYILRDRLITAGYDVDTHIKYKIPVYKSPDIQREMDLRAKKIVRGELELILLEFKTTNTPKGRKKGKKQLYFDNLLYPNNNVYLIYAHYEQGAKLGIRTRWIK